jgi:hypothetical protein
VLKAPTHCGVWGRVFLGSLSLAFYYARRPIRTQDHQDANGDTLPLRPCPPFDWCANFSPEIPPLINQLKLPSSNKINFQLDKLQLRFHRKGKTSINAIPTFNHPTPIFSIAKSRVSN